MGEIYNNPYYRLLLEIANNPAIDVEIPRRLRKNRGLKLAYIESRYAIALILYHIGGIVKVPATNPQDCARALAKTFYHTIVRDKLLKEFIEYWWQKSHKKGKRLAPLTEGALISYILKNNILKEGKYLFYEVKVEEGYLVMNITPLFIEVAKSTLPEITLTTTYVEIPRKEEPVEEGYIQEPSDSTETKEEDTEKEEKKERRDFWDVLLDSIKVLMVSDKDEILKVPVLRLLYSKAEGSFPRGDVFFLVLDLNKLVEWAKKTKIYQLYSYYDSLSEDEAAKEFVITRLAELFQADEEAYFRIMSIAVHKILEKVYEKLQNLNVFKGHVPFGEFVRVALLMSRTSEVRNVVLTVLRNPNFILILPKELIRKSKYATIMLKGEGVFAQETTNITFESHMIFRCKDCGRYFVSVTREKVVEESGKRKKETELPHCPFCQGHNVDVLYSTNYKFKPIMTSYTRVDTQSGSEKFYAFASVAEILGPIIEAETTPLVLVPFHQYEKKGGSPVKVIVPVLVGIVDTELFGEELEEGEYLEKASKKLNSIEDPLNKLLILAKSVNVARQLGMLREEELTSKTLKYVDYAIISHLVALATSTNKKILIQYENGGRELLGNLKPSLNLLSIGESSAAKSTIADKIAQVFPDKVFVYSLFKFTARQLSGYASQYRPRKSILTSMPNKMLILDEASYAREEGVYAVFRNILEYGKVEDGSIINTTFTFIMNDPLNINLDAAKGLRSIRTASKVAAEIQKKFGDFNTILSGLYSYMMLGLVSLTFTKAFLERIRMFIIARDYSKIYADLVEVSKKYMNELQKLKSKDLLLTLPELRALFMKKIFPITTIIIPEKVVTLATKYAKFFNIILKKVGGYLDESLENIDIYFSNLLDISTERIKNALLLIASGIAKLTRFNEAYEENGEVYIELTKEDLEIAKYFFITFSPDYLQTIAMQQLDELFKHLESNIDKINEGMISAIEFDTLSTIASQVKVTTFDIKVQEEVHSIKVTPDILAKIATTVIYESYQRQEPYLTLIESAVTSLLGQVPKKTMEEIYDKMMKIIEVLKKQERIVTSPDGIIYDIYDKSILSKKKMRMIISTINFVEEK